MKLLLLSVLLFSSCSFLFKGDHKTSNSKSSIESPYVILISVDGLRHDYIKKYSPPTLSYLKQNGLTSESLSPIFPSKTFPNHYSIITGMYAENHGLISNSFYDKEIDRTYSLGNRKEVTDGIWYRGEPLWVTAKKNKMVSASFFWVGSEAEINGIRPDYYFNYDGKIPGESRVDQVIDWLKLPIKTRPHFITLYFSEVDSAGHKYGPNSLEVKTALFNIDDYIHRLLTKLAPLNLPVNIILVSDHGMTEISNNKKVILPAEILNDKNIKLVGKGALSLIYKLDSKIRDQDLMKKLRKIPNVNIFTKTNTPKRFHYQNNNRIPDFTISPELGFYITTRDKSVSGGSHGYDPKNMDMHGVFLAFGPNIKPAKINTFENIHIYPFITKILNIKSSPFIDGKAEILGGYVQK